MNKKLQVFVSSTYTDLKEERQAAVEAILDAGHIPAGMELFKAGNESQLKTIYRWIDESDVYLLILGGRYGSIEKESGKSYTQLEYEYALSKNIPIFSLILTQDLLTKKINSIGLEQVMEQFEPAKYQLFKALVMSKIIRKIDDCKDIKVAITLTIAEFINDYQLIGWVRGNCIEKQTLDYKSLTKVLKHIILYNDQNAYSFFLDHIGVFSIGVSNSYDKNTYYYYSNIFLKNNILEKVYGEASEELIRLSKYGADYYNYTILNEQ